MAGFQTMLLVLSVYQTVIKYATVQNIKEFLTISIFRRGLSFSDSVYVVNMTQPPVIVLIDIHGRSNLLFAPRLISH